MLIFIQIALDVLNLHHHLRAFEIDDVLIVYFRVRFHHLHVRSRRYHM